MKKVVSTLLLLSLLLSLSSTASFAQGITCDSEVTVQADDWLSKLADKFYGDPLAFPAIASATNTIAAEDDSFAVIERGNIGTVTRILRFEKRGQRTFSDSTSLCPGVSGKTPGIMQKG